MQRLPSGFEPYFAVDERRRAELEERRKEELSKVHWSFSFAFLILSSRFWDRLYLVLLLAWSILCPGYMDGLIPVERGHLALLFVLMCALAAVPSLSVLVFKGCFHRQLGPCTREAKYNAGVFFVLATRSLPVPQFPDACCRKRVHPGGTGAVKGEGEGEGEGEEEEEGNSPDKERRSSVGYDLLRFPPPKDSDLGDAERGRFAGAGRPGGDQLRESVQTGAPHTMLRGGAGGDGDGTGGGASPSTRTLELPENHWRCILCQKVNPFPQGWEGKAGSTLAIVVKRKEVDTQSMYTILKPRRVVPSCHKCYTPYNYRRRGLPLPGGSSVSQELPRLGRKSRGRQGIEAGSGQSALSDSGSQPHLTDSVLPPPLAGAAAGEPSLGDGGVTLTDKGRILARKLLVCKAGRAFLGMGRGSGPPDFRCRDKLWYNGELRKQLKTYYRPQLPGPTLGPGERYQVGARVLCYANKDVWYPGFVELLRENNTYDVRYENGEVVQHVFPHMIRFQPRHEDSPLIAFLYAMTLATAVVWPLLGFLYYSSTAEDAPALEPLLPVPALVYGLVAAAAVATQFLAIYMADPRAGLYLCLSLAALYMLPFVSLSIVSALAVAKAYARGTGSTWLEVAFLPGLFFSFTGYCYARVIKPAYGKAWAVMSGPWLLFVALLGLKLDSIQGAIAPAFGAMRWMGIFSPLWVLLLLTIAAHHVLPLVWDLSGDPEPTDMARWVRFAQDASLCVSRAARRALGRGADGAGGGDADKDAVACSSDEQPQQGLHM